MWIRSIAGPRSLRRLLLSQGAAAQSDFRSCLSGLRSQAAAKGISGQAFDAATRGVEPDLKILELMDNQPEFKTPIWDYLAALVDEERVQDGQAAMRQWGQALAAAEARYGVDRFVITGVWGVESNFGKDIGGRPLVQSLTTIACYGPRRRDYFTGELMATLKIIEDGDIDASRLRGSWAGAFGHTQFMPSTFQRLAVDLDGDGRRDIVDSVPDAVNSTANFLKQAGWVNGLPWGYEVRLPAGFKGPLGRKAKRPVSAWAAMGVTRVDGRPLSGEYQAGIIAPAGLRGPAFLVTRNFDAVYSYNAAESYGLAIAILGDRLQGAARHPHPLADRRPAALARRAPGIAAPSHRPRLRCRRAGRAHRPKDPRRDQGRRAPHRHGPDRPPRRQGAAGIAGIGQTVCFRWRTDVISLRRSAHEPPPPVHRLALRDRVRLFPCARHGAVHLRLRDDGLRLCETMAMPEDPADQARNCWRTIGEVLAEAGASLSDIVRCRYYVTDAAFIEAVLAGLRGDAPRDPAGRDASRRGPSQAGDEGRDRGHGAEVRQVIGAADMCE